MTGPSLAIRGLAALVALSMIAGIAAAGQSADAVAGQTDQLEEAAGAVEGVADTPDGELGATEDDSAVAEIGAALAAAGEAIADAARAIGGAVATTASAIGDAVVAVVDAVGTALVETGSALADATLWFGQTLWSGLVLVGDGAAWLGAGTWGIVTAIGSGIAWATARTADGLAWIGVTTGHALAAGTLALVDLVGDGFLAIGEAWPDDGRSQAIVASSAGGTAAAAGAAWYTRAWRYLRAAPLLAPLYSRIGRDELLEHPKRAAIHEAVEESPGIHLSELARELDLSWGTLLHHLRKLEKAGLVISDETQGKRCFFLPGQVSTEERSILPALENEKARRIAEYYVENPGVSQSEAADALGYSPALISWHLNKLEEAGVVERERVGRCQRVGVTQEAMAVVAAA